MAQYVDEQRRGLEGEVELEIHSTAAVRMESNSRLERLQVYLIVFVRTLLEMARFARRRPTDVVHVHTAHSFESVRSMFYVLYTSFFWRSAVVLHVHGSSYGEFVTTDSVLLAALQSALFGSSDSVVVISERLRDTLAGRIPEEKLFLLPNAVHTDDYDPALETDPPRLVFLAYYIERKGIRELETAIRRLNADGTLMQVELAGEGPLSERAETLARRHENVTYHGYVSERAKRRLLGRAAVLVLPSRAECVPLVILEAMAAGTAIVSTSVGGIPEVVSEEQGVLVPPADADSLTDSLSALLDRPDRIETMAAKNRNVVEERYDWEYVGTRLVDHYEELLVR